MLQVRKKSSYNLLRSRDSRVQIRLFLSTSSLYFIVTGANRGFLPPSLNLRVQIPPFCPRRPSLTLSLTASRARSAQGASQAEFLREGIFRCRAGVGGQGSRAAMESPQALMCPLEN